MACAILLNEYVRIGGVRHTSPLPTEGASKQGQDVDAPKTSKYAGIET